MVRAVIKFLIYIFSKVVFRVKVIGKDNIKEKGAYIICANHTSNWDPPMLISNVKRKVYVMAKEELFKNSFLKWLGKQTCVFPVKRGKKDIESIKFSLKVLKDEQILGIFPEGTRNGMEKNGKAQNGAAYIALRTGTSIIPIGIQGNFKPFTKIIINIGKPIEVELNKTPEKEALDNLTENLMSNIKKLTNEKI